MCDNVDVQNFCMFALIMTLWFIVHIYLYLYRYLHLQFMHHFMHYVNQCMYSFSVYYVFDMDWLLIVKGVNAFKKFYDAETLMEVVSL